ncbi:MAG: pyridoxal-phosphate dependent enzyme, partial [Microvirga sp.]
MNAQTLQAVEAVAPASVNLPTYDDVVTAAWRINGVAHRTPVLTSRTADERTGGRLFFKAENFQRGGAFKFRGAYTYLSRLAPSERERGVIAPSSGNHAQAVALAAKLFGVPATVVMPTTVTAAKRAGAERLGARVVLAGTTTSDRYNKALEIVRAEGGTLVPPYDDPSIIAG